MKKKEPEENKQVFSSVIVSPTPLVTLQGPSRDTKKAKQFYKLPVGAANSLIEETLQAGENISNLPARKKQVSHGQELKVLEKDKQRQINYKSPTAQVTIHIRDIQKLTGSNKPAKKLFTLIMIKANEQAIHNGQLGRNYVSFPIQELIDIGFYKTRQSAQTGFTRGIDTLTSIKIKGEIQQGKNKSKINQYRLEVLFTGAEYKNKQCTVFLNERINWAIMTQYFTILPDYIFRLPNRAFDLANYIFEIARQRTAEIEKRGYFTIGFRAIQARLQLPNEKTAPNPLRDIKDAILEDAIEPIEIQHNKTYHNTDFSLLPVYDDNASYTDFLDNGYLKVSLKGEFAEPFKNLCKEQEKQIKAAQKRKDRMAEKAIVQKMADSLPPQPIEKGKPET